jgi:hypothetical protein
MRRSALGTAQFCNAPTNGDAVIPLPLPNELVPPVAVAAPVAVVLVAVVAVDVVDVTLCGLTGASIGAVAVAPVAVTPELSPLSLPAPDVEPDVLPPLVPYDTSVRVGLG